MPKADSKWVSISMTVEKRNFPLSGSELKEVIESLWIFPLAVNEPEKYQKWFETHTRIASNLTKLLDYADKYKEEIIYEPIIEEATN